ncbi:Uma2 family endonuclease [Tautonia plasticadhaerens]|uniref:Putative restriction endonuclease domain-containing protein n=1 Tax=Tautonia plasticadhaerens TaxID=2527974 RepID=A0A518GX51_9BACT|nr:Uma2 family endonuclease [Tautonia plasticadhaerens]QDV33176.1 hypothetical protein ElP_10180 [Tautonia plasticadhaerens]
MSSIPKASDGLALDEFLELPEIDRRPYLEYIDGRIVPKVSPQYKHGRLTKQFLYRLDGAAGHRGEAIPELRCTFDGRSIIPDVAFMLREHVTFDSDGEPAGQVDRPPDLHIEIISPRQSTSDAHDKLVHSTAHGCPLGWLVHPGRRSIDVYRPGLEAVRLSTGDVLDGAPVLPDLRLPVAEVFGWLRGWPGDA